VRDTVVLREIEVDPVIVLVELILPVGCALPVDVFDGRTVIVCRWDQAGLFVIKALVVGIAVRAADKEGFALREEDLDDVAVKVGFNGNSIRLRAAAFDTMHHRLR